MNQQWCAPETFAYVGAAVFIACCFGSALLWDKTWLSRFLAPVALAIFPVTFAATGCEHALRFLTVQNLMIMAMLGLLIDLVIWISGKKDRDRGRAEPDKGAS